MNNHYLANQSPRPLRLGIDARFYGPIGKGLGRYIQEIVDNVVAIDELQEYQFVVFLRPENFDELVIEQPNLTKVLVDVSWYGWQEQIIFPYYIWQAKLDLIHFPHFNVPLFVPCPFVVTIHDLILTQFPSRRASTLSFLRYWFKHLMYRLVIGCALKRAKKIIAVSQFTKNDLIKQLKVKEEKIVVTYEGVTNLEKGRDSLFVAKLDDKETLDYYKITGRFLLYVGNAYPHKNLDFLLTCFAKLHPKYPDLRLVLVGRDDYFYKQLKIEAKRLNLWQAENVNSPIIFAGYVPDPQLKILYKQAFAYIFPSLYEGFGLPPLEAMANYCPVISSDQASLPEVLGAAAIYFSPHDEISLIEAVKKIMADEPLRQHYVEQGRLQVKKYDWWECARQTLEIYQQVARHLAK